VHDHPEAGIPVRQEPPDHRQQADRAVRPPRRRQPLIIKAWTEPGDPDRPSEDWYGIADQPGPIVVLDGGTARTDTGCIHEVAWFTRQLGTTLLEELTRCGDRPLTAALGDAIQAVADLHRGTCDLSHPGTPSAGVAILRPAGHQRWDYAVLGDVTIVIDTPPELTVVVDHRISQSAAAARADADRWPIGSAEKDAALIVMKQAELAERNRTYWVAAADPTAAGHALTGVADGLPRAAILTDGAARAHTFGLLSWHEILIHLDRLGPAALIRRVRQAEADDPSGSRWRRNKRSDDATAVYLECRAERSAPPSRRRSSTS